MKYALLRLACCGFLFTSLVTGNSIHAQTIATVAGTGTTGYSGDGGPATAAMISTTFGVTTDTAGNVYLCDAVNNRVRKVSKAGIITTIAGTGAAGYSGDGGSALSATMDFPSGLSRDTSGNLYLSDSHNHVVRKITPSGTITTIAGTGISGFSGDGGPATAAKMTYSDGVYADIFGNVIIPDPGNYRIRKVDAAGIITTICGTGSSGTFGDGGPATSASIINPSDVTVDNSGNVYFTDFFAHTVRKISVSGIITTVAGTGMAGFSGDGGPATAAMLRNPVGIHVDGCGNLYVGDMLNSRVRKITPSGIISTIAGTATAGYSGDGVPASTASLYKPHGVHIDKKGNIYIADRENFRIRKIATANKLPYFKAGLYDTLTITCHAGAFAIDTILTVVDSNKDQYVGYDIQSAPKHGTLGGFPVPYATTGGAVVPSGLTYTPTIGYSGKDTFTITVVDCFGSVTMPVYVTVHPLPYPGVITGTDSVCPGKKVTLIASGSGGAWSSSNPTKGTISTTGVVTAGTVSGIDTIRYIATNACGSDTATFLLKVRPLIACIVSVNDIAAGGNDQFTISPNPAKSTFMINLSANERKDVPVFITNVLGEKIKELTLRTNTDTEVKLAAPPGIYYISTVTTRGRVTAKVLLTE